jgi:predicted ATPase/DNA-binding winged helix-turn-helix (wHTH) protein
LALSEIDCLRTEMGRSPLIDMTASVQAGGGAKPIYGYGSWEIDLGRRELRADDRMVPLGGRAFEILEILVQARGRVVSKSDIIAHVWPGAFVEENTLQVHVGAIRKAFGAERKLLRAVWGRGYALGGDWTARARTDRLQSPLDRAHPAPAVCSPKPGSLPLTPSALIGRAVALQQLRDYLSAYRLVTLVGAGGIGKTRLAIEIARCLLRQYQGDVRFVDLATLQDCKLVASAVASTLELDLGAADISAAAVAGAIAERPVLVLLDNCEHVIGACAELADAVLGRCPNANLLTTSREALRVDGELCFRVPPLTAPLETVQSPPELLRHSAVQFLVSRTEAQRGAAMASDGELRAIAAICRRLDGIPLALEFAAGRVASLGGSAVLARLDERFNLLTEGRRTALPKHRTLRATLDWSYDLLTEPERALLRFLSVFPAGCSLDAAMAVTGGTLGDATDVMECISNLVGKSLVSIDGAACATRWRLLETTRAYALERLCGVGEAEVARRRHATYFCDRLAAAQASRLTPEDLAVYGQEIDNVRAALDWCFGPGGDVATGIELTSAYVPVWLQLLLVVECTGSVQRALNHLQPEARLGEDVAARLQINLGFALLNTAGLVDITGAALRQGLCIADRLDDPALQLRALWGIWSLHLNAGQYDESHAAACRLMDIAERTRNPEDVIVGHRLVGTALHFLGRQGEAQQALEKVLSHQATAADRPHSMWFLVDQRIVTRAMLARVLLLKGNIEQALDTALRSLADAKQTGDKLSICYALRNALCPVALTIGDLEHAMSAVALLSETVARNGVTFWTSWANCLQGQLEVRRGAWAEGLPLLRAGIEARARSGWLMRNPEFMAALAEGLAQTGEIAEASDILREAVIIAERGCQRWYLPELWRIRSELRLRQGAVVGAAVEAEQGLTEAASIAGTQGALLWELRATTSLAGARLAQGRAADAIADLEAVYGRFTEGLDRPDLCNARSMLARCHAEAARSRDNHQGSNGLGSNGLGSNGLGSNGQGSDGLGSDGLGSNGLRSNGLGSE